MLCPLVHTINLSCSCARPPPPLARGEASARSGQLASPARGRDALVVRPTPPARISDRVEGEVDPGDAPDRANCSHGQMTTKRSGALFLGYTEGPGTKPDFRQKI